jgi:hypothetical protein
LESFFVDDIWEGLILLFVSWFTSNGDLEIIFSFKEFLSADYMQNDVLFENQCIISP